MKLVRSALWGLAAILLFSSVTLSAAAQGVTTAAVTGRVIDDAGAPVVGAAILLRNLSTGQRFQGLTREGGFYAVENVAVGGPYTLTVRAIGHAPATRENVHLALGQAALFDFTVQRVVTELAAVTVTAAEEDPLTSPSRTGTGSFVSDTAITRLPTLNRNFTDFILTVPQVEGTSVSGQHNRMNNIQIDGASNNDLFGLGSTGQPGGQVDAKSISIEAIREYQVLIAPFDVRQSGFSGGLINAITKRGTNRWTGSLFNYYQSDGLVGEDTAGTAFGEYRQDQRGFSLGGPLLSDRVHFFAVAEWQDRRVPSAGSTIGREPIDEVEIVADSAQHVVDVLSASYGVPGGSFREVTIETPNLNYFARLDFQLGDAHVLTLRHNYVGASDDNLSRSTTGYRFTSNAYTIDDKTHSTLAQLNSTVGGGRFYNELSFARMSIRDRRDPKVRYPELEVENESVIGADTGFNRFVLGAERFSQANELDQDVFEINDNLSFARGRHRITLGMHHEFISFRNLFFPNSTGQWRFASIDDLEQGLPNRYTRTIPYSDAAAGVPGSTVKGVPVADWDVRQYGAYAQDQWDATDRLTLTFGLRVDVPTMPGVPDYNGAADTSFGVRTDIMPSGNALWSPRFGFNWDAYGDRVTVLRGGAGIFSGRPAYVWLSNAYTNTGRETLNLSCTGAGVPTFTLDPDNQPTSCAAAGGVSAPTAVVNFFEEDFRFPQQLKMDLALDHQLPLGFLGTVEFLYTRTLNSIQLQEVNLLGVQSYARDGRPMYGTISTTSATATPARIGPAFGQVLRHTNASKDRAFSVTWELQRRFTDWFELKGAYTYQRVQDLTSLSSSIATSNFGFTPIGGDPNDPPLARSAFDIPHKVVFTGTANVLKRGSVTLVYTGNSGRPYTWTYDGDVNADGYPAPNISGRNNDIVYVPRNAADFLGQSASDFARLDSLIQVEDCLQKHRGSIMPRNACRNPWRNRFDAKVQYALPAFRAHDVTLVLDVFNVFRVLGSDWGLVRSNSFFETRNLLRLRSFDPATNQGRFQYIGPSAGSLSSIDNLASRWRIQLGVRYDL